MPIRGTAASRLLVARPKQPAGPPPSAYAQSRRSLPSSASSQWGGKKKASSGGGGGGGGGGGVWVWQPDDDEDDWQPGKKGKKGKKANKWMKSAQGAAKAKNLTKSPKQTKKEIEEKLKKGDVLGALAIGQRAGTAATKLAMPAILEAAAKKLGPAQYAEVLAAGVKCDMELDVVAFTRLCVILTNRVPVPTGMVRLTLNMALPKDGQVVPLIPPDATEEEEKAVFEDGEVMAIPAEAAPLPQAPSKELGPRPEVQDASEVQEARAAMTKVQPTALRGRVKAQNASLGAYFGHFVALLHLETLVELRALKRRLQRPPEKLEQFGWMVQGLQVRNADSRSIGKNSGGALPGKESPGRKRSRVVFALPPGTDTQKLRIRAGDSVLISRKGPLEDLLGEGIVVEAPRAEEEDIPGRPTGLDDRIIITFDGAFDEKTFKEATWRLDSGPNRTAYERQFMALLKMATTKVEKRMPLWDLLSVAPVGGSNVDEWAAKMRAMMDSKQKEALEAADDAGESEQSKASQTASSQTAATKLLCVKAAQEPPLDKAQWAVQQARKRLQQDRGEEELNPSQREAVAAALGRRLTLVQGPPGTGKTTVSVRLLSSWAKCGLRPLLATSDSNIAVDNIAEGVHQLGLKVVRVGRPEKVTSNLEDITLESILRKQQEQSRARNEQAADGKAGGKGGKDSKGGSKASDGNGDKGKIGDSKGDKGKGGSSKGDKGKGGKSDDAQDDAARKQQRVDEFEAKMSILKSADVICTTTIASGSDFLHLLKFKSILIDEVAQATELSAIVPVLLRGSERLVLVGDHCQLPPSVCSLEAETRGLSLSLFGRLAAQGLDPYFLDTQFRMHPMIAHFSAEEFYHGKLKTGVTAVDRPPPVGFRWPQEESGIAFVHVDAWEQRDGESRTNPAEVATVSNLLAEVLTAKELSVLDVGVVTPYAAQVRALRQALRRELPARLQGTDVDLTGGLEGKRAYRALEVASVDAFQGREKELIIFSAVRSNRHGQVGFLADWRRLNVMITRARRGLIIIGNTDTLSGDPTWSRWLTWAKDNGLVVSGGRGGGSRGSASAWHFQRALPPRQPLASNAGGLGAMRSREPTSGMPSERQANLSRPLPRSSGKGSAMMDRHAGAVESDGKSSSQNSWGDRGNRHWEDSSWSNWKNSWDEDTAASDGTFESAGSKKSWNDGDWEDDMAETRAPAEDSFESLLHGASEEGSLEDLWAQDSVGTAASSSSSAHAGGYGKPSWGAGKGRPAQDRQTASATSSQWQQPSGAGSAPRPAVSWPALRPSLVRPATGPAMGRPVIRPAASAPSMQPAVTSATLAGVGRPVVRPSANGGKGPVRPTMTGRPTMALPAPSMPRFAPSMPSGRPGPYSRF
eukprot:TRINITY_DN13584_c0_g2_i1.p1 TRINITY_DN13584_c0_g2~~TRINITY_DN13584_c0_g2_i1.p1  ORF type:complete len:1432 (+),score=359.38 TRINITY_DN13584_c0_g2_i1:181-4296(+)